MAKTRKNNTAASNSNSGTDHGDAAVALAAAGAVRAKPKRTRKSVPRESPSQRSSVHRGVTRHRWTGRYEAHLWDKNSWNESQNKKGKQVYLGEALESWPWHETSSSTSKKKQREKTSCFLKII